jgi:hypothetical protein
MNTRVAGVGTTLTERSTTSSAAQRKPNFRRLLGESAWQRLPAAVQARFESIDHATPTVYRGVMRVEASRAGRLLAQLCRLIGTPVAPFTGDAVKVQVEVFDDVRHGGVVWQRRYEFPGRAPTIVRSTKRLDDDGGLVEVLNAGLHMRLRVFEKDGALHFLSTGYFFRIGWLRIALPDWFLPGGTHVVHEDQGNGCFRFAMSTIHRSLGRVYFQEGSFK